MKQVLIIAVAVIIAAVDFVMYCCLRVASQEDRILEKLSRRSESESDDDRYAEDKPKFCEYCYSRHEKKRNAGR